MKWIKKYGWLIFIAFLAGMLGNTFCTFIEHLENWGSVADWVSGIGSLFAIVFAYKQICQQKKQMREQIREYEKDKKIGKELEELHNRPFFSLETNDKLTYGMNVVWTNIKYVEKLAECFGKVYTSEGKLWCYQVKEKGYMYELKNISKNSAINITLAITYIDNSSKEKTIANKDSMTVNRGVEQSESITFMTPTMIEEGKKAMWNWDKKISVYFATVDQRWYRQDWTEEKHKKVESGFASTKIEYQGIQQIDATEVPVNNDTGFYSLEIKG